MSEVENDVTDVLLPTARVDVFSTDAETLESARGLAEDWRFARVSVDVVEGDVDVAIAKYKQGNAPSLIIIQTDDIENGFTKRLEALSEFCAEGTSAVVIGPVNDVNLYRRLIDMGVSDYLVRPVAIDVLSEVIARTLVTKLGLSSSHLIAFLGAKGGVGTSTLAQMAAWGVSTILNQKTVLLDASGGWSSLGVGMGFDPTATLLTVSRAVESGEKDSMKRMFFAADERLSVLATGGDPLFGETISAEKYEHILDNLMVKAPVVIVDLSGADTALKRLVISRAHQIILVATPTLSSLRIARSLVKEIGDLRGGEDKGIKLLVNRRGVAKAQEVTGKDIEVAFERKCDGEIPFLPSLIMENESDIYRILSDKEGQGILQEILLPLFSKICGSVSGSGSDIKNDQKSGLLGGFLTKLTAK